MAPSKRLAASAMGGGYGSMKHLDQPPATPTTLDIVQADGSVKKTQLSKRGSTICCVTPAGGWYGPFGFLRLVAYAFMAVTSLSALGLLVCLYYGDLFGVVCCVVLGAGAALATAAAYSHEGLAKLANALDRQNNKYAALRKKFDGQLDQLQGTRERLDEAQKGLEGDFEELMKALQKLARFTDLQQVMAIISAFVDADTMSGVKNARLSTKDQAGDFLFSVETVLEQECPWVDLDELRELTDEKGIDTNVLSLLIGAVINDDEPKRAKAMTTLMFFALDADSEERLDETVEALLPFLGDHPSKKFGRGETGLRATLERFASASDNGVLPSNLFQMLSRPLHAGGNASTPAHGVAVVVGK